MQPTSHHFLDTSLIKENQVLQANLTKFNFQGASPVHRGGGAGIPVSLVADRFETAPARRPPQQSVGRSPARPGLARLAQPGHGDARQGVPVQVAQGVAAGRERHHIETPLETGTLLASFGIERIPTEHIGY